MKNRETVCAVVVTYNRKELLCECLIALMKQTRKLDAIFIIDNASTDKTPLYLKEKGYINDIPPCNLTEPWEETLQFSLSQFFAEEKIHISTSSIINYVRMHENTGGAGGFYEGMKRGFKAGYDWMWLMDDDGIPTDKCLESLLIYRNKFHVICPLVMPDKNNDNLSFGLFDYENRKRIRSKKDILGFEKRKFLIGTANPFNGTLISRILVQNIGLPKKEMFIWGDETEYMLRAQKNGFKIVTILNAVHYHPKQKKEVYSSIIKLGDIFYVSDPQRLFIYIRNYVYLESRFKKKACIQTILKYLVFFIFQRKMDVKGLTLCIRAIMDGLFNRFKLDL